MKWQSSLNIDVSVMVWSNKVFKKRQFEDIYFRSPKIEYDSQNVQNPFSISGCQYTHFACISATETRKHKLYSVLAILLCQINSLDFDHRNIFQSSQYTSSCSDHFGGHPPTFKLTNSLECSCLITAITIIWSQITNTTHWQMSIHPYSISQIHISIQYHNNTQHRTSNSTPRRGAGRTCVDYWPMPVWDCADKALIWPWLKIKYCFHISWWWSANQSLSSLHWLDYLFLCLFLLWF